VVRHRGESATKPGGMYEDVTSQFTEDLRQEVDAADGPVDKLEASVADLSGARSPLKPLVAAS
jgi:hypothetical protein